MTESYKGELVFSPWFDESMQEAFEAYIKDNRSNSFFDKDLFVKRTQKIVRSSNKTTELRLREVWDVINQQMRGYATSKAEQELKSELFENTPDSEADTLFKAIYGICFKQEREWFLRAIYTALKTRNREGLPRKQKVIHYSELAKDIRTLRRKYGSEMEATDNTVMWDLGYGPSTKTYSPIFYDAKKKSVTLTEILQQYESRCEEFAEGAETEARFLERPKARHAEGNAIACILYLALYKYVGKHSDRLKFMHTFAELLVEDGYSMESANKLVTKILLEK